MELQTITAIIMIATLVLLLVWDLYVIIKAGGKATISYIMAMTSLKFPLIPFAWGLLTGHFFWQIQSMCK